MACGLCKAREWWRAATVGLGRPRGGFGRSGEDGFVDAVHLGARGRGIDSSGAAGVGVEEVSPEGATYIKDAIPEVEKRSVPSKGPGKRVMPEGLSTSDAARWMREHKR